MQKDWDGAATVLSKEMKAFLDQVVKAIADRNSAAWPGGTGDKTLSKRSGDLMDAILGSVKVEGQTFQTIQGTIGAPGIKYARIQETGGTITPKTAKFLTIPLPAALDSRGVPLKSSARAWPEHIRGQVQGRQLADLSATGHLDRPTLRA